MVTQTSPSTRSPTFPTSVTRHHVGGCLLIGSKRVAISPSTRSALASTSVLLQRRTSLRSRNGPKLMQSGGRVTTSQFREPRRSARNPHPPHPWSQLLSSRCLHSTTPRAKVNSLNWAMRTSLDQWCRSHRRFSRGPPENELFSNFSVTSNSLDLSLDVTLMAFARGDDLETMDTCFSIICHCMTIARR